MFNIRFYHLAAHIMNLKIMAEGLGCQAYFFIFDVTLVLQFFNPTFHVEAMKSSHLSLSPVIVTLVHQHVPVPVAVLSPILSCSLPLFCFVLPASECLGPMSNFCSQYQSAHGFRIKVVLGDW